MNNKSNKTLSLRKLILSALVAAPLATLPAPLWALPGTTSANVTSSSAATTFVTGGTALTVVTPDRSVLTWVEFGGPGTNMIAAGESVNFNLPSASSSVLNTISGTSITQVNGAINSNGSVFIINPNGITVSNTGSFSVAGLGLSTVSEAAFTYLATGNLSYVGTAGTSAINTGAVIVNGSSGVNTAINTVTSLGNGSVTLVGRTVDVSGTINSGSLTVTAKSALATDTFNGGSGTSSGVVRLAVTAPLTLGTIGSQDNLGNITAGAGNLTVTNSNSGAAIDVAVKAGTTIRGGTATLTSTNGNIQQTTGTTPAGSISSIGVTTAGTLYTVAPTFTIPTPAGGTQATAVAVLDGVGNIASINVTNAGSGYGNNPAISINLPGTQVGAGAVPLVVTSPMVTASGAFIVGDTQSTGNVNINAGTGTVNLSNVNGNGQTFATGIIGGATTLAGYGNITLKASTITGPLSTSASLTVTEKDNSVGSVAVDKAGNTYLSLPVIAVGAPNIAGGTQATVAAAIKPDGTLNLTLTNAGTGYTSAPTVTTVIATGNVTTTGVVATVVGANVTGVTLTGANTGHIALPTISIAAPTTGARALAHFVNTGGVLSVVIDDGGTGYTGTTPAVTITYPTAKTTSTGSGNIGNSGDVTIPAGTGTISLTANSADGTGHTIAFKGPGDLTFSTLSASGGTKSAITVTSTNGAITLPAVNSAGNLTVSAATNISQVTGSVITAGASNTNTVTFDAVSGSISLPTTTNAIQGNVVLKDSPAGVSLATGNTINLGTGTVTGAATLTSAGDVNFGRQTGTSTDPVGDAPKFMSTLNVTAANITDTTDNAFVFGTTTLDVNAVGKIVLDGNLGTSVGLNSQFGQLVIGQTQATKPTSVKVFEKTTLNLGAVSVATPTATISGGLTAISVGGDIVNTGVLNVAGPVVVGAGSAVAPGNINLNYTAGAGSGNKIGGIITIMDDTKLLNPASPITGNFLANNVAINNELSTTLDSVVNGFGTGGIAGTLTINSGISLSTTLDTIASLVLTPAAGGSNYTSAPLLTLSAPSTTGGRQATATATLGTGSNAGVVTGFKITDPGSGYTALPTITAVVGPNGAYLTAPTATVTGGGGSGATVVPTLSGGTSGQITAYTITGGSGYTSAPTITLVGGTGAVAVAPTATIFGGALVGLTLPGGSGLLPAAGTFTLAGPSINLGVARDSNNVVTGVGGSQVNVAGNLTLNAQDAITATNSGNLFGPVANITAAGNVSYRSSNALTVNATLTQAVGATKTASFQAGQGLTIGTIVSNYAGVAPVSSNGFVTAGTPSVTFTSGNNKDIVDSVAGISIFGDVKFASNNAITITKAGHSFGGITASNNNDKDITITESGSMKLVDINANKGNLTLTSTNGDIVQSTDLNATKGVSLSDNNGANKATFNALNGKVTLDNTIGNLRSANNWPDAVINVTAGSDVVIKGTRQDAALGNITTPLGKLTVDMSGAGSVTAVAGNVAGTGGSGYFSNTVNPAATTTVQAIFTGGGGTGAAGFATVDGNGAVTGVTMTNFGSGYTSAPVVTVPGIIAPGGTLASTTTAPVAVATGSNFIVQSVPNGTIGTFKYMSAPAVTFTGGVVAPGGAPATAIAVLNPTSGLIIGYSVTNQGLYSTAPTGTTVAAPPAQVSVTATGMGLATDTGIGSGIKQAAGTKIFAYDTTAFKTINGTIAVTNLGNNFGGLVLSSGTSPISITEGGTMNLKGVATTGATGTFTAISERGNIIDSTDATVLANYGVANKVAPAGAATLTANGGNISLTNAASDYGTVSLNTTGNAFLIDNAGTTDLGASTVSGTLDILNSASLAITQSGALTITGATSFTASGGSINLPNSANQFGGLRFVAGAAGAIISEATTLNLRGGSVSTGPVTLNTAGNFVTSGVGGSSITNDLTISATGTIIPGAGSLLVTGNFTVFSGALKDLSALSLSGNLVSKAPINLGAGAYTGPGL